MIFIMIGLEDDIFYIFLLFRYDTAIAFFYKALGTYRSLPENNPTLKVKVANVYTNLGVVYGIRRVHDKEMEFFKLALNLYQEVF